MNHHVCQNGGTIVTDSYCSHIAIKAICAFDNKAVSTWVEMRIQRFKILFAVCYPVIIPSSSLYRTLLFAGFG